MKEPEVIALILILSTFLQLAAATMAFVYGKRAFQRVGWTLLCVAFVLMIARRIVGLLEVTEDSAGYLVVEELIALSTSLLVLVGICYMGKSFQALVSTVEMEKKIREKEQESFRFMQTLFDSIPIPTFAVDTGGRVILWNRACEKLTGMSREGLLGRKPDFSPLYPERESPPPTLAELLITMTPEEIAEKFKRSGVWLKEGAVVVETEFSVEDSVKAVKLIAGRIYDERGVIRGAIQTAQDVTSERRMEQYLRTFQKLEAVGRLVLGIAHDFRNILMIVQAATELIPEDRLEDEAVKACMAEVRQAVRRGSDLCTHLMRFAGSQDKEEKQPIFLNTVLVEWERTFRRLLRENIHFRMDLAPDLWAVNARPGQIERIVTNLALNAQEAIPDGGSIVVRTENVRLRERDIPPESGVKAGRFVRLTVEDTGVGMDEVTRKRIFEPFFSTKVRPGGMGLYVVYSEVRSLGGFIDVRSEPGKGTAFDIYLPALCSECGGVADDAGVPKPDGPEEKKGCVLLVEDEVPLREMLAEFLARKGFTVHKAGDGREALEIFESIKDAVDIVIADLGLPGEMDGYVLIDGILSRKENIKIVVMTGYAVEKKGGAFTDKGFVEVINKPFSMADVMRLLEKWRSS
ncbi:hybrid sensor histidine kinase/response regulator [Thermodesulforhabdus norvegica]|uniref:histidine kinase n=1 Tax=Thermodesulforhabdus norvegica TaxID=39841 RepID=A0A1I4SH05_9BACT|nr:response regulator [Thermodesulforhabdus norvegica]SFM63778.1 PAS domain S-box-containing protein [Thermodesulforhabdus norvegica]